MNNLDFDEFNKIVSKIDNDIGINSATHKDTVMALAIIVTKGKEFRHSYRNIPVNQRHYYIKSYIKKSCPNAEFDVLRFSLFKEGFISPYYFINFCIMFFVCVFLFGLKFVWFDLTLNIDDSFGLFIAKVGASILSFFAAGILTCINDIYLNSKLTSYFGLGASNK